MDNTSFVKDMNDVFTIVLTGGARAKVHYNGTILSGETSQAFAVIFIQIIDTFARI